MQNEFLQIPSTIFEAFYGGAAGGGKSDILLMLPIVKGWYKNPQFNGAIFRRTFPQLEESLIHKSDTGIGWQGPTYWDFGGRYDRQKHVWTFYDDRTGERLGTIRFLYSLRESDVHQHDTAEFHYLGFDELTHFTWYQYSYLLHRCRSTIPGMFAVVRTASNPGNIGHTWVYKRFVEPTEVPGRENKGRKILVSRIFNKETNEWREIKRIFIPAKATDNPYLTKAEPDYVLRLGLLPEAERKAKAEGDWHTFAGQMFSEFRSKHHEGEPDNALHVIPPIEIPRWWPKLLILDWGYEAMTYALWLAVSPWRRVYAYREAAWYRKSIQEYCADLRRLNQNEHNVVRYIVDPSADKHLGQVNTIWEQIISASGMPFEKGDNDRIGGIGVIHDFLRWKPRPPRFGAIGQDGTWLPRRTGFNQETADRIFRMYGTKALEEYQKFFAPDVKEDDLPLLHIFDNCKILIQTIPMVVYAESKASGKKVEDYAEFDGDDPIDTLRYGLKGVERFMKESSDQWQNYLKIDAAIEAFKRTGNYNDMDRALTQVEHAQAQSNRSVRRGGFRSYLLKKTGGRTRPRRYSFYPFY